MKNLIILCVAVLVCSCTSRVDKAFDSYIQTKYTVSRTDSIDKVSIFKRQALMLSLEDLDNLNKRIREFEGDLSRNIEIGKKKNELINSMLNESTK